MKKRVYYIVILFLFIFYLYFVNIENIPNQLLVFGNEVPNFRKMIGINTVETSSVVSNNINKTNLEVKLFNFISVKNVAVTNFENYEVVPVRESYRIEIIYKWCINCWNV